MQSSATFCNFSTPDTGDFKSLSLNSDWMKIRINSSQFNSLTLYTWKQLCLRLRMTVLSVMGSTATLVRF